jgi:hypothetical protein
VNLHADSIVEAAFATTVACIASAPIVVFIKFVSLIAVAPEPKLSTITFESVLPKAGALEDKTSGCASSSSYQREAKSRNKFTSCTSLLKFERGAVLVVPAGVLEAVDKLDKVFRWLISSELPFAPEEAPFGKLEGNRLVSFASL